MDRHERSKFERMLMLKSRLEDAPQSTQDLMRYFKLDLKDKAARRNLNRDLLDLELFVGELERPRRGVHYISPESRRTFHPLDALSVYSVMRLFYHHAPTGVLEYRHALEKLAAQLPQRVRDLALSSLREVGQNKGGTGLSGSSDRPLELAMRAWTEGHPLHFEYLKSDKTGPDHWEIYTLEIYFIEVSRTNLSPYLIGHVRQRKALRTFKLSLERICNMEILSGEHYQVPSSFDPRKFLSDAWGVLGRDETGPPPVKVRLRFDPEVAYLIKEGHFPGLTYPEDHKTGSLDAEAIVAVDKQNFPREILPWVLSFGRKVQVLEPENLCLRVRDEAKGILEGQEKQTPDANGASVLRLSPQPVLVESESK